MAKRRKAPPARKAGEVQMEEHSLLLRSAESLGRVIGALQRQLDDASRRMSSGTRESPGGARVRAEAANGKGPRKAGKKKAAAHKPARKRKRTTH